VVVQSTSPERTEALDAQSVDLQRRFVSAACIWRAGDAPDQPHYPLDRRRQPNRANVRFLIDNAALPPIATATTGWFGLQRRRLPMRWPRPARADACKARGFDVTYWQADERGRWQRRQ